jgi:protoporphyrinogen oxidase
MKQTYKYIILGAGPSGLSLAHALKQSGEESFLVIENEPVAGGLCRSEEVDGSPLDIGGGHFLDIKRKDVLDFLFQFLPHSEWQEYSRISKINIRGTEIDYPFEANLWQLPIADRVDFLESIAKAGCVCGTPMPESFEEWIYWKLGDRIAEEYMLPYNRKIWSTDLDDLGTYWLYKLPDVSFRETLLSCLEGKPAGSLPAHGTFLYPRHFGYGEVWKRMGDALGDHLLPSTPVTRIDIAHGVINDSFRGDKIITSIPWTAWPGIAEIPASIESSISSLRNASIDVDYTPDNLATEAHWIYDPDERLSYHRILCRSNFCHGSRGYWTETNSQRAITAKGWRYRNEFAYPLNTLGKPEAIATILAWADQNNIIGLGRWGTWEHMNSDVAVSMGITAAKNLLA